MGTENSPFNIGIVSISTPNSIPISDNNNFLMQTGWDQSHAPWFWRRAITTQLQRFSIKNGLSDLGVQIKVYSDVQYNVRLCSLQSDIRLSLIPLIPDIGLSVHLCISRLSRSFSDFGWYLAYTVCAEMSSLDVFCSTVFVFCAVVGRCQKYRSTYLERVEGSVVGQAEIASQLNRLPGERVARHLIGRSVVLGHNSHYFFLRNSVSIHKI